MPADANDSSSQRRGGSSSSSNSSETATSSFLVFAHRHDVSDAGGPLGIWNILLWIRKRNWIPVLSSGGPLSAVHKILQMGRWRFRGRVQFVFMKLRRAGQYPRRAAHDASATVIPNSFQSCRKKQACTDRCSSSLAALLGMIIIDNVDMLFPYMSHSLRRNIGVPGSFEHDPAASTRSMMEGRKKACAADAGKFCRVSKPSLTAVTRLENIVFSTKKSATYIDGLRVRGSRVSSHCCHWAGTATAGSHAGAVNHPSWKELYDEKCCRGLL
jgi:hypothetical protein